MFHDIPEEQIRRAVEDVAAVIVADGGVYQPPVDAIALAESLGMSVLNDAEIAARARFTWIGGREGQGTILVASDDRPERRQWAIAHELGECFAHRVADQLGIELPEDLDARHPVRETIANRLASCILLPRDWFRADGYAVEWDLAELKGIYSTASNELIASRWLDVPPAVVVTMLDAGRVVWRRNNRGLTTPPMTPPERDAWRVAHEQGKAARCDRLELPAELEDVRAWPVHEPGWRREFVRVELGDV